MSAADFPTRRREALSAIAGIAAVPFLPASAKGAPATLTAPNIVSGRDMPFNNGWLFRRGAGTNHEAHGLDDRAWRALDLPHDWSVEDIPGTRSPFDKEAVGGGQTGFTQGGEGWYRKHFRLDGVAPDARIELSFDGIYEIADVWLNGTPVGGSVAGYSPFALDLTSHLNRFGNNVLAVHVRNEGQNSRWYTGSGIYREVRLDVLPANTRIARWGVGAWTRRVSGGAAEVEVTSRIIEPDANMRLVTRLRDAAGRIVAEAKADVSAEQRQVLRVRGAHLWSPSDPYLHTLETEVHHGSTLVDRSVQPFGLRIVTFDPERGMAINGEIIKLRGGCVHHDTGLLGACAFREADERRIRLLKARGFNAIRSSHNTASRSLRDACDRLGMLMIDEAFDMWHFGKNPQDFSTRFAEHWHEVLEDLVLPARNSPSVIMWSIGNEIPRRTSRDGIEWQWRLANAVRLLDPSRPVTAAIHGTLGPTLIPAAGTVPAKRAGKIDNASLVFLDIPGFNYRLDEIEIEHHQHPERVVYASETFARNVVDYRRLMDAAPYFLGEFLWTAMDYIGEAAIGRSIPLKSGASPRGVPIWPYTGANCGDLDLTGAQKPPSLARDVAWGISPLEVLVKRPRPAGTEEFVTNWGWPDEAPSWTWPEMNGIPMTVSIFTAGNRVDVLLNGTTVERRPVALADKMHVEVQVPFAPGQLEVIAYIDSREVGRKRFQTDGPAARLLAIPERHKIIANTQSLAYIRLCLIDAAGAVLCEESRRVSVTLSGPAKLVAFGSGNPQYTGSLQSPDTELFRGQALLILRSTGESGSIFIDAQANGAASTFVSLPAG